MRPHCLQQCRGAYLPLSPQTRRARRVSIRPREAVIACISARGRGGDSHDEDDYPPELPTKFELMQRPDKLKPLVRVRLSVEYRVHSRQMLCIGGSQIPLGWSFLSISKVPMTWNSGDVWTCEVSGSTTA